MSDHKYDNEVQADNKFGHTLELLARHMPEDAAGGVHLDIACGFGHIAEPLIDTYKIPSSNRPGGMTILNAATQRCGKVLGEAAGGQG